MRKPLSSLMSRRRALLAGAGTAGALAAAASVLPPKPEPTAAAGGGQGVPDAERGYRLTQHVLRYYQTARV